jgi:hypothetical protein
LNPAPPSPPDDLCILVTVYAGYRHLAGLMTRLLDRFWPAHPPVFLCGAEAPDAGGQPLPRPPGVDAADWVAFTRHAADQLLTKGYRHVYLLCEEHVPLAPCHEEHLNRTLPAFADARDARYIGLMGWDNRRYTSKAPVLGPEDYRLKHLTLERDPRFHLHPALWRIETLIRVCDLVLPRDDRSPWRLEKEADHASAALPEHDKSGCYQVCAETLGLHPARGLELALQRLARFAFHRAMALYPALQRIGLGKAYWELIGFDDFLYPGPYPLFYSGIMVKGRPNEKMLRRLARSPDGGTLAREIRAALVTPPAGRDSTGAAP